MDKAICLGSGFQLPLINDWDTDGIYIVGVNNVWRGTKKWNTIIHPNDYGHAKELKNEKKSNQEIIAKIYNPKRTTDAAISYLTGIKDQKKANIHAGLTMYFPMMYWTIYHIKPKFIGCLACDMVYKNENSNNTSFYGIGEDFKKRGLSDPSFMKSHPEYKNDPNIFNTLFERLKKYKGNTKIFNLSTEKETVLPWERISFEDFKLLK